jgi:NAD(P)-dependent dehydrogenase (short-subunit alcohol dehydrogenase family)
MELKGTNILVTGGAKRVGRAIVERLASKGARVFIHYHTSEPEALELVAQIRNKGGTAECLQADLATPEGVESLLRAIEERGITVDVLVNNASVFFPTPMAELDVATWDRVLAINLRAPMLLCRHLGLAMFERQKGKIINIADTAIRRPYPKYAAYLVSKAGLAALTSVLALEFAPHVQVNAIAPGTVLFAENFSESVRSAIVKRTPLQRVGSPEDIAAAVEYLIVSGDFITGIVLPVDGGAALGFPA